MGLIEIVLPSKLFSDNIFKVHLLAIELDANIAVEFELPIDLLLDKLISDETRGPYEIFCLVNVLGSIGRKAEVG